MSKKLVAGIVVIVIVAVFLVIGGLWYMGASSHKQMCANWHQQIEQRRAELDKQRLELENNYGLLTSDEQKNDFNTQIHALNVQADNYNAECSPNGRTNLAGASN